MVDIRNIISYNDDVISVKITDSYWNYLHQRNVIQNSNNTTQDKKNHIAELDSEYSFDDNNVFWEKELSFKEEDFMSIYSHDNNKIPLYLDNDEKPQKEVTKEEIEEAKNFLNSFSENTDV